MATLPCVPNMTFSIERIMPNHYRIDINIFRVGREFSARSHTTANSPYETVTSRAHTTAVRRAEI